MSLLPEDSGELKPDIIITETSRVKEIIKRIYLENSFLNQLEPRKFEEIIAELLFEKGFEVELTKQTRDNGYDIIALKRLSDFPVKFLVECKRYRRDRPIGIEIIRSFYDVIKEEKANKGIIFTTSYFSATSIKRKEKEGTLLDLKDRKDVIDWVNDYLRI